MLVADRQFNRAVVPFNRLLALAFDTLPLFLLDGGPSCSLYPFGVVVGMVIGNVNC